MLLDYAVLFWQCCQPLRYAVLSEVGKPKKKTVTKKRGNQAYNDSESALGGVFEGLCTIGAQFLALFGLVYVRSSCFAAPGLLGIMNVFCVFIWLMNYVSVFCLFSLYFKKFEQFIRVALTVGIISSGEGIALSLSPLYLSPDLHFGFTTRRKARRILSLSFFFF